ncbi:MAG: SH3 domain-containing protein [Lachnospiraceae bacterium]|nr:SH3 domain-containing protein [Lachnospiraceae bacterium]MBR5943739.1 SH3 domain-containing protein [Lachnospiraceae bacterium]
MSKQPKDNFLEKLLKHSSIIFPILLVALVAVTVLIALQLGKNRELVSATNIVELPETSEEETATTVELQVNAYPEVNALIQKYYQAVLNGDIDAVMEISNSVADTEQIRIKELSKYLESYPTVDVYTKPGPEENSFIAYVYYLVKFNGYENAVPGIEAYYICTDEEGKLYMNEGIVPVAVTEYINNVNMDEDVVELFNKVAVEYNDLLVSDPGLSIFLQGLNSEMEVSVGEALAAAEAGVSPEGEPTEAVSEEGEETSETEEGEEEVNNAETSFARTNTSLNVRISDSENADKIGQLSGGVKIEILEKKDNGWCKILYENKEAYVKTDYLSIIEDVTKLTPVGVLEAKDTVNVRMAPTVDSDRIGTTYVGEKVDYFEIDDNGWAKVNYNQSVGYVKAEYFNKE